MTAEQPHGHGSAPLLADGTLVLQEGIELGVVGPEVGPATHEALERRRFRYTLLGNQLVQGFRRRNVVGLWWPNDREGFLVMERALQEAAGGQPLSSSRSLLALLC